MRSQPKITPSKITPFVFDEQLLRPSDAAKMLGIGKSTLFSLVKQGRFPKGRLIAPRVRVWSVKEIKAFLSTLPQF
jgi:predicted DNA-binding transcriptional regulator AlpA